MTASLGEDRGGFAIAGLAAVFVPWLGDADAAVPELAPCSRPASPSAR